MIRYSLAVLAASGTHVQNVPSAQKYFSYEESPVRCAYHPDKEASAECARCKKPLCEECSRSRGDKGIVLCGSCLLSEAATYVAQAIDERNEEREARKEAREVRGKRKPYARVFVIMAFAVAVLLVNLYFHLAPGEHVEQFDPYQDPYLTAVLIESALLDYANSHKGEFPMSLNAILDGGYLSSDRITEGVLQGYAYTRSSPHSYELRIKESPSGIVSDTVFTEEEMNR